MDIAKVSARLRETDAASKSFHSGSAAGQVWAKHALPCQLDRINEAGNFLDNNPPANDGSDFNRVGEILLGGDYSSEFWDNHGTGYKDAEKPESYLSGFLSGACGVKDDKRTDEQLTQGCALLLAGNYATAASTYPAFQPIAHRAMCILEWLPDASEATVIAAMAYYSGIITDQQLAKAIGPDWAKQVIEIEAELTD